MFKKNCTLLGIMCKSLVFLSLIPSLVLCFSLGSIPLSPEQNTAQLNNSDGTHDAVCYDHDGYPTEGDIPHDRDCNLFISCVLLRPGIAYGIQRYCQPNLYFSISTCQCEHTNVGCFDPADPDDRLLQYNCVTTIHGVKVQWNEANLNSTEEVLKH